MDSPWEVFGRKPIIGEVGHLRASLRRRVRYQGLFRLCLDVSLVENGQTRLTCREGPHPVLGLFTTGWAGPVSSVICIGLVFAIAAGSFERHWPLMLLAPVLLGGLWLLAELGDAEADHSFLIAHVARMTDAVPI